MAWVPWNKGLTKETDKRVRMAAQAMKGKKRSQLFKEKMSKISTKSIPLTPTEDLGYFCGLIIGDGYLYKQKSKNYTIGLTTTRKEFRDHFAKSALKVSPLLKSHCYEREHTRTFPNGTIRTDMMYSAIIDSKIIHDALRPSKQPDYLWQVPSFLDTKEAQRGFLQGIFDAEGSVIIHKRVAGFSYIQAASKHKSNLLQIEQLLKELGIQSYFSKASSAWTLRISNQRNLLLFKTLIGFRLPRKRDKLVKLLSHYQRGVYKRRRSA